MNTLHRICELERTQLLTILAMSVQNPQLAGYFLAENRRNFLRVEGSTACLFDCAQFLLPLYEADNCFDRKPLHYASTANPALGFENISSSFMTQPSNPTP